MSLKTVLEIQKKKNYKRRELREDLYKKIKNRIDYYARFGKTNCQYEIPSVIYGYPHLDMSSLTSSLVNMLKEEGFIVVQIDTNKIFISWEETVIKEYVKKIRREKLEQNQESELNSEDQKLLHAISKLGM